MLSSFFKVNLLHSPVVTCYGATLALLRTLSGLGARIAAELRSERYGPGFQISRTDRSTDRSELWATDGENL